MHDYGTVLVRVRETTVHILYSTGTIRTGTVVLVLLRDRFHQGCCFHRTIIMLKYHIMQPDPDAPTRTVEYSTLLILVRHGIRAEPGTAGRAVVGSVLAAVHYGTVAGLLQAGFGATERSSFYSDLSGQIGNVQTNTEDYCKKANKNTPKYRYGTRTSTSPVGQSWSHKHTGATSDIFRRLDRIIPTPGLSAPTPALPSASQSAPFSDPSPTTPSLQPNQHLSHTTSHTNAYGSPTPQSNGRNCQESTRPQSSIHPTPPTPPPLVPAPAVP